MEEFNLGDEILYNGKKYILALFLNEKFCSIRTIEGEELTIGIQELKPYVEKHEEVFARMRTNEALEEDLKLANIKIADLQKKLNLTRVAIVDAQSHLEESEHPFYKGLKTLKGILNNG